ncbi:hypothetical protein [Poseidonocella sp. HB161398]|uniref:hypothetical protein n=1 Tax=Poseidonocella sp. HB161398 TaxID=2320855 RepID=UPI001486C8B3|nr:hypothetical protein [Poseidonocella sp. HB161398]
MTQNAVDLHAGGEMADIHPGVDRIAFAGPDLLAALGGTALPAAPAGRRRNQTPRMS